MRLASSRVTMAALLTALAILVPSIAWYVAGRHDVERDAAEQLDAPARMARETAGRMAGTLETRLSRLMADESSRPFYHYQNLYHDPRTASEGVSITPSPLAQGPTDPLVHAYFQLDPHGRVSLPTLNDEIPEQALQPDAQRQRTLRAGLGSAVAAGLEILALERKEARLHAEPIVAAPRQDASRNESEPIAVARVRDAAKPTETPPSLPRQIRQSAVLDPSSYAQNVNASQIYSQLKSVPRIRGSMPPVATPRRDSVVVRLGPLRWRTLPFGGAPSLAAMRLVESPQGSWLQGFMLSPEVLAQAASGSPLPTRVVARPDSGPGAAAVPIGDTGWWVRVDAAAAMARARAEAAGLRSRFHGGFAFGLVAALLAGASVVGIVWQSERLARQRSLFAAAAAHELRTPLAGLRMHGEMLAEGLGDPERAGLYARRIAAEAERLGRVVTNVLGVSRLERGLLAVKVEPGDLATSVLEAVERQRPSLEASGVSVRTAVEEGLPQVDFDADAVTHIVQNLLDNAERHTREAADRRVEVSLRRATEGVELAVRDHGPGVPAERRRRLFSASPGRAEEASSGLGLGLVLVAALTRAQRGSVACDAPEDGGARFRVLFPARH